MRSLLGALLLVAACGDAPVPTLLGARPLLPLAEGNRWVYAVSTRGSAGEIEKAQVVLGRRALSGAKAGIEVWAIETQEGAERRVAFLEEGPEGVRRHGEEEYLGSALEATSTFTPFFLRALPAGTRAGDVVSRDHTEVRVESGAAAAPQSFHITWTVEDAETVSVPAGTFEALRIRRSRDSSGDKLYWWAPGVGKIKEEGQRVELLKSYLVR